MGSLLLIVVIFGIAFLGMQLIPSILNVLITFFIMKLICAFSKTPIKYIFSFIILSMLLGFNSRIPEIVLDIKDDINTINANRYKLPLIVKYGDAFTIQSDVDEITYKEHPFDTVFIKGSDTFSFGLQSPRSLSENIQKIIRGHGIGIDHAGISDNEIIIQSSKNDFTGQHSISLIKGGEIIAEDNVKYRIGYKGDIKNSNITEFILHNNFWNWALKYINVVNKPSPILPKFLYKYMKVKNPITVKDKIFKGELLTDITIKEENKVKRKNNNNRFIRCQKVHAALERNTIYITVNNIEKPIIKTKLNVEKILCYQDELLIIETPSRRNEIKIMRVNYDNKLQTSYIFQIPEHDWKGYPRKPLRYFERTNFGYLIGIEEFGKGIKEQTLYYKLIFNDFN